MARSKATLLRRSGVALYNMAGLLGWSPTLIFQVGVGKYSKETEVFREAWPDARLIGFEPHPTIFWDLQNYHGRLFRRALGRYRGRAHLFWHSAHRDGASVYDDSANDELEESDVEMDVLDGYAGTEWVLHSDRVLLWLDCEGSELDVLMGGERFVERVEVINVELSGIAQRPGWPSPVAVNRWLLDRGFWLQYVHTQRTDAGQVDTIYVRPSLFKPEYCPCPLTVEKWRKQGEV